MAENPGGQGLVWANRSRWIAVVAIAAASLAILYLGSINVLLRTRLLRHALSTDPATLWVDYESAYSIIPGRVHVVGLAIRGRERTEEWVITIDRVDFDVAFRDLLRHRFHATHVHASGFGIRARLRIAEADATPDVVAALPTIPGFESIPLEPPGEPPPPLTDANYHLWSIELEDVTVEHVREVWIHTVRGSGDMRVRGRWLFRPMRWLEVGPASVEVASADVSYGVLPLLTGLHGSFDATIHPFDVRVADGLHFFDFVSTNMRLGGLLKWANAATAIMPPGDVVVARGEGPLDADLVLDHGTLMAGTHVSIEANDPEVDAYGMTLGATANAVFEVKLGGASAASVAALEGRLSDARVLRRGVEQARVATVAATFTTHHLHMADAFDDTLFAVDVHGAETNDLEAWRRFVPSAPEGVFHSGVVMADGHVDGSVPERHLRGKAKVVADGLRVELARASVRGKLTVNVVAERWAWADRTANLSGSDVTLREVSARSSTRVEGAPNVIDVPSVAIHAQRLELAPSGVKGNASLDLERAVVRLSAVREIVTLPNAFDFEGGEAQASLHAELDLDSGQIQGESRIVAQAVRAKIGASAVSGDVDVQVKARGNEREGESTDFSGTSVAITHAGAGDARAQSEDAWWGTVDLAKATLSTRGGPRLEAQVHVKAKDASPATVLVSQNAGVPEWAANIFRMPILDATADLRFTKSSFDIRSLVARGGAQSIRMEYARHDQRTEGALLADLGLVEVGYDLTDGATGIVLLGSETWFNAKVASMRAR
jgi:hypothetical protein